MIREIITDDGRTSIRAKIFIDATYEGDLLAAAGASYAVGREANSDFTETLNGIQTANSGGNQLPGGIDPYVTPGQPASGLLPGVNSNAGGPDGTGDERLQAYTFRMCLTDVAANRMPVPQPPGYQESDYELLFRAIAAGQTSNFFKTSPMPNRKTDSNNSNGYSTDFIGGNYNLAEGWNYAEADYAKRDEIIGAHIKYQQGLVWTLQNSPRVPLSIRNSVASWGLPMDEFLETGMWPAQLYVREARRLMGEFIVTQRHVNQQPGFVENDSIGMGGYNMDSHHTQRYVGGAGVRNEGDVQVGPSRGPYGISYRAIVPKADEVENLLVPVCVSSTHIAFGSIRMEPVFMILGQSAGAAAVRAIEDGVSVQHVAYSKLRQDLVLSRQVLSFTPPPVAGEIIVDNASPAQVTTVGEWLPSSATAGYYGTDYLHDNNSGQGTKGVRFTPSIPEAGMYQVFARWPAHANRATNVRYEIVHASGSTPSPPMNQRLNNGTWMLLGTFQFSTGSSGSVMVRNDSADGYVIADAIRLVPEGAMPRVSLIAPIRRTSEANIQPAVLTVVRETPGSAALEVQLEFDGSATSGVDFRALPVTLTIPAGGLSASLSLWAFPDSVVEGIETVVVSISPNAAYAIQGSGSATLSILDPPYDAWKAAHFSPAELGVAGMSGDSADPDLDGQSNLLEFALGSDPKYPQPTVETLLEWTGAGGPQLRLYYEKGSEDMTYLAEQNATLDSGSWTRNGVSPEYYDAENGLFYQASSVLLGEARKFLRLRTVKP